MALAVRLSPLAARSLAPLVQLHEPTAPTRFSTWCAGAHRGAQVRTVVRRCAPWCAGAHLSARPHHVYSMSTTAQEESSSHHNVESVAIALKLEFCEGSIFFYLIGFFLDTLK